MYTLLFPDPSGWEACPPQAHITITELTHIVLDIYILSSMRILIDQSMEYVGYTMEGEGCGVGQSSPNLWIVSPTLGHTLNHVLKSQIK